MPMKVQEAYRTPNRVDHKIKSPRHIIIKGLNVQNKEKILRAAREKGQVTYKGKPIRITPDFSLETLKARRTWLDRYSTDVKRTWMPAQTTIPSKAFDHYKWRKQDIP